MITLFNGYIYSNSRSLEEQGPFLTFPTNFKGFGKNFYALANDAEEHL